MPQAENNQVHTHMHIRMSITKWQAPPLALKFHQVLSQAIAESYKVLSSIFILGDWVTATESETHGTEGKSLKNEEWMKSWDNWRRVFWEVGLCLNMETKTSSENPSECGSLSSGAGLVVRDWCLHGPSPRQPSALFIPVSSFLKAGLLLPSEVGSVVFSPDWCPCRISAWDLCWRCGVCRCHRARVRPCWIRMGFVSFPYSYKNDRSTMFSAVVLNCIFLDFNFVFHLLYWV